MIQATLFRPESQFCRANAPREGLACLQVTITLPNNKVVHDQHWLALGEVHCVFDPKWLYEHVEILWKKLLGAAMPVEILVVERITPERRDLEKTLEEDPEADLP